MDIIERYISAYIVECLTGISGQNQAYYSILSCTHSSTRHPLLRKVLEMIHERNPRDENLKKEVKKTVLKFLNLADLSSNKYAPTIKTNNQ